MPENSEDYKKLLTDLIQKHMVILGPNIALDKAKAVTGLSLADDGLVTQLTGDPQMVLKALVNEYKSLSGELATKTLAVLLTKYPNITFQETP